MELIQYIFLGIVQGFTEFLPISSSGHLIILKYFMDIPQNIILDITLHLGTLIAVLIYYKNSVFMILKDLFNDAKNKKLNFKSYSKNSYLSFYIIFATIPAAILGASFDSFFESLRSLLLVSVMLVAVSIYMLYDHYKTKNRKNFSKLNFKNTFLIGLSQVLALIPGTSRSGMTITTGSLLGLSKKQAADFTFLLSIPIILGAFVYKLKDVTSFSFFMSLDVIVSFVASFIAGYFSIGFLLGVLKKYGLIPFVIYRILLAVILLFFLNF
ncbi:hypothetical protein COV24_04205 [candidate division WWE3 bacterium CG10_big_fil_rev_8_21_14_0_10_32_10]|uniref:Undecaprenyl-diphosphatase n=1 Tax=candidate division WWE3 bacterium CG10_big_fil_rev_8_21_14_0_10_32_10 TaxID=1975090 RepID=A0A2H0R9J1_UNCKA|nr:MAG: hypothetical protein COV24_04205 [candidate division WWE3 bacterium CG10_big_fil_rev_8_21_14_0_10_32_10]